MWSKIISWILAAITALMNGFGMYTQEYKPYVAAGEYEVQEEAVDYMQLRSWYINSYGGSNTCKVERNPGTVGTLNTMGFCWLVRGGQHNPDAKIEFEDGTVIVAPSRGKVTSSPNSSGNKIVVSWDSGDYSAYRLEVINPVKWFCCMDAEPTASGLYMHSNVDHRIELSQGDAICVAGPETTLKMYRGNNAGTLAECSTIREFLLYTTDEGGDPNLNLSVGADLQPTTGSGTTLEDVTLSGDTVPGVDGADIWEGTGVWAGSHESGWWFDGGNGNWPQNQYMYDNGNWYYFDNGGYAVTGWASDNHYYLPQEMSSSLHPECSMAVNAIVPKNGSTNEYVLLGADGLEKEATDAVMTSGGVTYSLEGDHYVRTSTSNGNTGTGSSGGSGNSVGGSNNNSQGGQTGSSGGTQTVSDEVWENLLSGGTEDSYNNQWVKNSGEYMYVLDHKSITQSQHQWSLRNGMPGYLIDGVWYVFQTDGILYTAEEIIEDSVSQHYYNNGANGIAGPGWVQNESGDWMWARDNLSLAQRPDVIPYNGYFYIIEDDHTVLIGDIGDTEVVDGYEYEFVQDDGACNRIN